MASPTKRKPAARVRKAPAPQESEGRKLSLLAQHGDRAKIAAEGELLLKTLKAKAWNLSHTAAALEMGDASSVLRALDRCGIREEYEKHKA